jgi:hypothetical protein
LASATLTLVDAGTVAVLGVEVEIFIPDGISSFAASSNAGGAVASCAGDSNTDTCVAGERLVWTVGTVASGSETFLSLLLPVATNLPGGRVLTFNASAHDTSGFSTGAHGSRRTITP